MELAELLTREVSIAAKILGIRREASTPMMASTPIISISVKPFLPDFLMDIEVFMFGYWFVFVWLLVISPCHRQRGGPGTNIAFRFWYDLCWLVDVGANHGF